MTNDSDDGKSAKANEPHDANEVEEFDDVPHLPTVGEVLVALPGFLWRVLVPCALLVVVLSIPIAERVPGRFIVVVDVLFMGLWGVLFLYYLRWQVRSIHASGSPELRWIESIIVLGVLFVGVFARSYRILSVSAPDSFTQPLSVVDSYYYALGTLSTTGTGTLAAVGDVAKMFTMGQIIANLAFIGLVVRVLSGAASKARTRRTTKSATST